MNESVIRSPKWLRNFVDFEINTGEDIKGEPSKKMQKKIAEEQRIKAEKEKEARRKQQEQDRIKREKEEKEADEKNSKIFEELFQVTINYIYKHYQECTITIPKRNFLSIEDDELLYNTKKFKFKLTLDNTITHPTFDVYIKCDGKEYDYRVSGLTHTYLKQFILNYVYEYYKANGYKNSKSSSSSSSSSSKKDEESLFNDYFKYKYGFNINDFTKKTNYSKYSENDHIVNKRRRYNLLKETLIGYERELYKIIEWEKVNVNKTHPEKERVKNEIDNLKRRMKQINDTNHFENKEYNFTHLKRFNS